MPMPSIGEAKIQRILFQGQPGKKLPRLPISTNKLGIVVHLYNPSYMGGVSRRIAVRGWPGRKKQEIISVLRMREGE
jgi:hypothetical protein